MGRADRRETPGRSGRPLNSASRRGWGGADPERSGFVIEENRANRNGSYLFSLLVFCTAFALAALLVGLAAGSVAGLVAGFAVGVLSAATVRVAMTWERVVVTRFGTVKRVAGPGIYLVIPFLESASMSVDQRLITTSFTAEEALTSDLVPVDVDAVIFWMVWNARKACTEVQDYPMAVAWSAQTALRDVIGRTELGDLARRRKQLDAELQEILDTKSQDWGITVVSVEIRNIIVPEDLQDALSQEAQAEREKNARILLAEVERDISELLVEAADTYDKNETALQLRTLSAVSESTKKNGGLVIAPSGIGDVLAKLEALAK